MWVVTKTFSFTSDIKTISIHTTHVGGDHSTQFTEPIIFISIHTTHVGGDALYMYLAIPQVLFQSTPPMWVVTYFAHRGQPPCRISIHTTHVGGDFVLIKITSIIY